MGAALGKPWSSAGHEVTSSTFAPDAARGLEGRVTITSVSGLRPDFKGEAIGIPTELTLSIAETISAIRTRPQIVGAFTTTIAEILALFSCGDGPRANEISGALIAECRYDPVDVGPLRSARTIETLAWIWARIAVVTGLFSSAGPRILHSPARATA